MRNDLKMRKGKMVAQGAHAAMKQFFDRAIFGPLNRAENDLETLHVLLKKGNLGPAAKRALAIINGEEPEPRKQSDSLTLHFSISPAELNWINGSFTKICCYVNSENELVEIHDRAISSGLRSALITDSGRTEFNGVPTKTCCAIGPDESEKIDLITGHLPLL